jgi:hypothetical protein
MQRFGDWMQTATGKAFWPLDPRPEEVDIVDIASALSKICRYGGHCERFYSVAEHSVHVAYAVAPQLRLKALLHDAPEAYLGDVIRPLKRFLINYDKYEQRVADAIATHFGLDNLSDLSIKEADGNIILDEHDQAMRRGPAWTNPEWGVGREPLGVDLEFWKPDVAKERFTEAFLDFGGVMS